jgi:type IV pilus assembly protein PilE
MRNKGFTLLELIIVIVIVGVLASLALPRLFAMVERSRSTEAMADLGLIRQGMEFCLAKNNGNYGACPPNDWNKLGIDNPFAEAGSHFFVELAGSTSGGNPGYMIVVSRNANESPGTTTNYTMVCASYSYNTDGYGSFLMCKTPTVLKIVGGGVYDGITYGN